MRGERIASTLRLPKDQFERYERFAAASGHRDLNAYLVASLAAQHGLEAPWWAQPSVSPETLDIPGEKGRKVG